MYKRSEADPIVGTLFDGRYLINFLVARGGMGNIYQAHDVRRGHIVALKMLRPEFGNDPVILQRFQRETLAVSNLHHENICQLYDTGCTPEGVHYFTMEFLEGQALDTILKEKQTLPQNTALLYITQIASALCDAHNHGIIHRDLKPANIFIVHTANGEEVAKVLDFGVAKLEEDSTNVREKLTNAGSTLGTPFYMSPEQIQGKEVDARTDVYALGIILWECLFGNPPYTGNSLIDVFTAAIHKKLPKLPSNLKRNKRWKSIYAVLQKALQKDRNNRYDSMQSFLRALEQLNSTKNNQSSQNHPSSTRPSLPVITHFHSLPTKIAFIVCSIIFLCICAAVTYFVFFDNQEEEVQQPQSHTYKFYSTPSAEVRVNNKIVGNTPLILDLDTQPPFDIVFRTEEDDFNFRVDQHNNDIKGFMVNLGQPHADSPVITLNSTPPGADVYINDHLFEEKTPCKIPSSEHSITHITIKLQDYRTESFDIAPKGSNVELNTTLSTSPL